MNPTDDRMEQAKLLFHVFDKLTTVEMEMCRITPTSHQADDDLIWTAYFNTIEFYSLMVNSGMIKDEHLLSFFDRGCIDGWMDKLKTVNQRRIRIRTCMRNSRNCNRPSPRRGNGVSMNQRVPHRC